MKLLSLSILLLSLFLTACQTTGGKTKAPVNSIDPIKSIVNVSVTSQAYNFVYPWNKKQPYNKTGYATYISGNRYLVTASMIQNANFIQLKKINSGDKVQATVECVDYLANLAIVKVTDKSFNQGMVPLKLVDKLDIGDSIFAHQFESNGLPLKTEGILRKATLGLYIHNRLLVYQARITLPQNSTKNIPITHNGGLVGIMLSYSSSTNSLTMIPGPVISHFLKDYDQGTYAGFPSAGFSSSRLDDPELRRFVKLPDNESGIYITYVRPDSPSAKAGLKEGDVLLSVGDYKLDRNGEYKDPNYGNMSISNMISTHSFVGDILKFKIWRDGKIRDLDVKLESIDVNNYPSTPFIYDRGPDFIIVGGQIFTELSRQFLKEWRDWQQNAPPRLRHYDRKQWDLFKPGEKLVISSMAIPTPVNQAYERFAFKVLKKVNGKSIKKLADVEEALKTPVQKPNGQFHVLEFDKAPKVMVFGVNDLKIAEDFLRDRYNIRTLKRISSNPTKLP